MVDQGPQGFQGPTGPVNAQGVVAPPARPSRGPQGPQGQTGFIGSNGVIDRSPTEGFIYPPTIHTHPTGINVATPPTTFQPAGSIAPIPAYTVGTTDQVGPVGPQGAKTLKDEVGPVGPQGAKTPKDEVATPQFGLTQNQITAMQATQRAMEVLNVSPNLKTHPDIVAALAYNTSIPWTPQTLGLIGAVQKARSAVNYASQFTMEDYNQTAKLVDPKAYYGETFAERLGRGLDMEGRGINDLFPWLRPIEHAVSWEGSGLASNAAALAGEAGKALDAFAKTSPLTSATEVPIAEGAGVGEVAAIPPILPGAKQLVNFVADQFDTPEHLYRYIASVEHKYGAGMAFLAALPTVAGALVGTALGGVGGSEGAAAGAALDEAFANTVVSEGLSDLAAATLAKRDLSLMEERAATLVAQRAARVGNVAGQLGRIVTAPVNLAAKVATSPISLGADVGFTGGGQVIYRQDYMDSRDGTAWAKKYPMLASTFGRFATQNMDPGGWKTFLSGSLDAIAATAVPDALGSAGRVVGIARSAEGFTGGLLSGKYKDTGNWFGNVYDKYGGLSRSGDGHLRIGGIYKTGLRLSNVDAFYNESAGARQTVNLIAQMGNAGEIIGVDARFAPIADLLAKARVVEADGTVNMTKSVENVKQVLRDSQTAAELMERPLAMTSMPITANSIYRAIREGAKGVTPGFAEGLFSPLPIYADSKTLRMENREFTVGNRDALPAIRDMLGLQYGYGVANQVVDELANNLDPHFWQQTIVNTVGGQMAKEVAHNIAKIKLPDNIAKAVLEEYDKIIPEKLRQVFNFGGPHQQGSYGYAVLTGKSGKGANLSRIKERIQKASDEAISESVLSQASKYGMTKEEFAATGETLHHGTIAKFDNFDPTAAGYRGLRSGKGARHGGFYFTENPDVAAGYGERRNFTEITERTLGIDRNGYTGENPGGEYFRSSPEEKEYFDAQLREHFAKALSEGKIEIADENGKFVRATTKDLTWANVFESNLQIENGNAGRTITTKVYGKTIDLRPPKNDNRSIGSKPELDQKWFDSLPEYVQKWLTKKFGTGSKYSNGFPTTFVGKVSEVQKIAENVTFYGKNWMHESDPEFAKLLQESANKGYGKIKVFDDGGDSGGQSIVAHPDYIAHGQDPIAKYGESGVKGPVDVPEDLFGGNHKLTDVVNPLTQRTIPAAIVPEELGKMHLPSYLDIQRVQRQFADMLQERYKDAINVAPDIEKLTSKIADLTKKRIAALSDPEAVAKFDKQIENAKKLLAIKQQIGANVPKEMPNFGYGVFKKGLAAGSNTYDFIDHYYNNMFFKQLALATGGWAMRTGMSEASLNIFREGPLNYTAARLAASVARHERAVLHIGEKFTRQAAEDIAARIYHLIREDGMLGPNGAVFTSEAEAYAAVANVRKVANEANLYLSISDKQIVGAIQSEEGDMNSFLTSRKVSAAYRGFMVGAKSQILKQLNKQDLLDAAIRLMYLNDGHIVSPMLNATHAGIAQDLQTGSETEDKISQASWKNPFITNNKTLQNAKLSKSFHGIEGGSESHSSALQTRSQWMGKSKIYAPTFVAYNAEYHKAKETLLATGETELEASSQAADIAAERIRPLVKKLLDEKLTNAEKKALLRTTHPLPDDSLLAAKTNPLYADLPDEERAAIDHVTAVIKAAEGHVRFIGGSINEPLLSGMAKGEIPSDLGEFKKQMMSIDGKLIDVGNFNLIPGPELDYANYSGAEKALNATAGKLSNSMHKKILGPIVNRLTRDPIYIVDFAAERKLLNAKVTAGEMTRDEADTIAQVRASVNAMRYIHNPKNKLKFENMMRLWSPFYFAENQAWRRLGRLAWTNPGAAEQYTKAMYQTQQVVYQQDQKNNNMGIPVPGSSWLNKQFFGVDVPFEVSPNSLRTVFPWSAESGQAPGIGSLIGSFLPKSGPILSIPANLYLQKEAGLLPGLDKFLGNYVVGQAGVGQPMLLGIFPNSIMANIVKGAIGWLNSGDKNELSQNALSTASSSYISANIMVQTALLDAKQQEAWKKHKDDPLPSDWAAAGATQHEYAMYGMMNDIEQQFHSPEQRQAFLDSANWKTTEIFALKTLAGGASPLSVLLGRSNVQYSQEFQADLTATGSVLQAANMFLAKHPDLTAETLFTTTATSGKALGVAWPTTPGTADFMLAHKDDIAKYPAVMRFALQEGSQLKGKKGYDQMAHFLQTSWGLRAQKTPTGFLNSYLDSVFNQFHYGVLQPMGQELIKQGYSFNEVNNILLHNSTTWKSRENNHNKWSILEQFGKTVAPLAFSNYLQGNSEINRSNALQQLREVIAQPSMLAKYENFRDIKDILMPAADQLIAYKAEASKSGDSTYRDQLALQWNSELDRIAADKPNLLPVIQQIFRPLAPIFTN